MLTRGKIFLSLDKLGFSQMEEDAIRDIIIKPHGIFLVTGPTGSGKSTSLYAFLSAINSIHKRIITIEEPVEYELKGINQIAVRSDIGLTFAMGLRHILRQDPNVVMVGEIRDTETAEIAIRASLTGHLVFSTLHTNDAPSAFTRLIDMGIEPFLVASSVEAVMAQRLIRTICPHCKTEQKVDREYLRKIGFPEADIETAKVWHGAGCEECRQLGYQGRKGIYELLLVTEALRPLIMNRAPATTIAARAMEAGMRTLRTDGWNKVKAGVTTIEEVLRVTQMEEHMDALVEGDANAIHHAPMKYCRNIYDFGLRLTICVQSSLSLVNCQSSFLKCPAGIPATFCTSRPTPNGFGSLTRKARALCWAASSACRTPSRCRPNWSPKAGRRCGSRN